MIKSSIFAVAATIVSLGNGAQAQSQSGRTAPAIRPSPRAELIARVDPAVFKFGSPANVKLTLKNNDRDPIHVMDTFVEQDYEILVVDDTGKEAKRTNFGRHLVEDERKADRAILLLIEPGQQVEASVDITKIYNLTEPRLYYVRVMRWLLPESDDKIDPKIVEMAVSNPCAFTLVE